MNDDEHISGQLDQPDTTDESRESEAPMSNEDAADSVSSSWIKQALPTMIVFALLIVVGLWGHYSHWKIPKFSELIGSGGKERVDWCSEHGVPESICVACNADLMPKGQLFGWCKEHGVHECTLCNPQVAQLKELPRIGQTDLERAERALQLKKRPENNRRCKMHLRRVQFPSSEAADMAGIDIDIVDRGRIVESVTATGEITYDQTHVARLSSRAAGTIWRADKKVGDHVSQGDVLALVEATEVGRTKSELLQAVVQWDLQRKNYDRLAKLEAGVVAGRRVQEAETALADADVRIQQAIQALINLGLPISVDEVRGRPADEIAQHVHFLGIPDNLSREFDATQISTNLVPVKAPIEGEVVEREVVAGEVVATTRVLFTVADTRHMWLTLSVPLEDAKYIALHQPVQFQPDGADFEIDGTISWISTAVDQQTRTVKVRAELSNLDSRLRDETFGIGRIVLRDEPDAVLVPKKAVHWEGCCFVAFVRERDFLKEDSFKVFHTRMIRPGVTTDSHTEIIAGLLPGEVIVSKGSGVLRAELLKGNLGAG